MRGNRYFSGAERAKDRYYIRIYVAIWSEGLGILYFAYPKRSLSGERP